MDLPNLSPTSLAELRECPQKWAYSRLRRLERASDVVAYPLEFGTWWHALKAAEGIHRGTEEGTLRYCPRTVTLHDTDVEPMPGLGIRPEMVLEAAAAWWRSLSPEAVEGWQEYLGAELPDRLEHADRIWHKRWSEDIPREAILAVEIPLTGTIPGTQTQVRGIADVIIHDEKRGMAVLRDYKTAGDTLANSALHDQLLPQPHLYGWMAAPLVREWGLRLGAISYDRVRSTGPKSPVVTATGNLSKSVKDYDLETYLNWVGDGVPWGTEGEYIKTGKNAGTPKFGVYTAEDEVINNLSSPLELMKWVDRTLTPLNPQLILGHLQEAQFTANYGEYVLGQFNSTGSAPRNLGRSCRWCDFQQLCAAELRGGAGEYPLTEMGLRPKER